MLITDHSSLFRSFRTTVAIAPPAPVSATSPSSVPRATIARKDIKATAQSGQSAFVRDAMKRSGKWDGQEGGNNKTKKGKKTESLIGPSNGRVPGECLSDLDRMVSFVCSLIADYSSLHLFISSSGSRSRSFSASGSIPSSIIVIQFFLIL